MTNCTQRSIVHSDPTLLVSRPSHFDLKKLKVLVSNNGLTKQTGACGLRDSGQN